MNRIQLAIGTEVAIREATFHDRYTYGHVVKITSTGQITVETEHGQRRRFNSRHLEMGGASSVWRRACIVSDSVENVRRRYGIVIATRQANAMLKEIYRDPSPHAQSMPKAQLLEEVDRLRVALVNIRTVIDRIKD